MLTSWLQLFSLVLLFIPSAANGDNGECEQQGTSTAGTGNIKSDNCDTDNCKVSLSGWDHQITLNVTCPYSNVMVFTSGYGHNVTINCFNCYISQRFSGGLNIINNTNINTSQFNNIENCACSAITKCQLSTTDDPCINSKDIELSFKTNTENEQYIECQKACYDDNNMNGINCIYGIYYSYKSKECRFITAACNWFDDIEDDEYHFVSKGCMTHSNGTFNAISMPQNNDSVLSKEMNEIVIVVIVLVVLLCIIGVIIMIFWKRKLANNKKNNYASQATLDEATATKTANHKNISQQQYPTQQPTQPQQQHILMQQTQQQQPVEHIGQGQGQMMMVQLPDGRTVMAQLVQPNVGGMVPSAPMMQPQHEPEAQPEMYQAEGVNNNATFQ